MQQAPRKIIHVDMDAFYASVEQLDHPELKGKPIAVGGSRARGVVAAASYEAREFGVRSAMPSVRALRLCPQLIFVRPRFDRYKEVSQQIRKIFYRYTDLVEPLSLDEAYLDVTHNKKGIISATKIAKDIQAAIWEELNLSASAGISINKFLAKVASDLYKPKGLALILPERAEAFLEKLPIEKFHGIGKVTAEKMRKMGIYTGADLKRYSEIELARRFGKVGRHYYKIVRAIDRRPVQPNRIRKSLGAENTFSEDLDTIEAMQPELAYLCSKVARGLIRNDSQGRTLTLKIKYHDFTLTTRSKTLDHYTQDEAEIAEIIHHLLTHPIPPAMAVRLLGVSVSNFKHESQAPSQQLTLRFED